MKKFNWLTNIGLLIIICAIFVGISFTPTEFRFPFILLGISMGIIIIGLGAILSWLKK